MSKQTTIALLIAGAICTAAGQIKAAWLMPFSEALAGLGFALAALAKSHELLPAKAPEEPPK